jgi:serine/threonine protein kinase
MTDVGPEPDKTVPGYRTPPPEATAGGEAPRFAPGAAAAPRLDFLRPPAEKDELGRLGHYRVLRLLGSGGMGMVFQAEDVTLRRAVALKVIRPDLKDREGVGERFLREARSLAAIKHDHLVTVYQAGQEGDVFYIAMELLQGETLDELLRRRGPPEPDEVLRVARETTLGLAAIHARGLVHRDLKPSNLWREAPSGRIRILDFGLARPVDPAGALTVSGDVLGTPAFMAPEQARGRPADVRSDLFSLGSVLYCLCTGRTPFQGDTLMAQLTALAVDTPPPPHQVNRRIPPLLSELVARLLEKNPAARPASAEAVLEELDRIARGEPGGPARKSRGTLSRPWVPLGVAALVCALAVGVVLGLKKPEAAPPGPAVGERPPDVRPTPAPPPPPPPPADERPRDPPREDRRRPPPPPPSDASPAPPVAELKGTYLVTLPESDLAGVYFSRESGKRGRPDPVAPPDVMSELRVGATDSPHGVGMHPSPLGPAGATFRLGRKFTTFRAWITLNNGPQRSESPLTFTVLGDGAVLYKSDPFSSQREGRLCKVTVKGVDLLRLEVAAAGTPKGGHGLWFEPVLD